MTVAATGHSVLSPGGQAAWRQEVTTINLNRLVWIWGISEALVLAFGLVVLTVPELRVGNIASRVVLDVSGGLIFFVAAIFARRLPVTSSWRECYVAVSFISILLAMDAWYFQSLALFGQSSDYVLGVVLLAVLILVRPRLLAVAFALNHIAFSTVLLASDYSVSVKIRASINDTAAVVIAWVAAGLLYRARRSEFFKARALEATNAELREVMAIAAHDLRSPLLGTRDLLALGRKEPAVTEDSLLARIFDQSVKTCEGLVGLVSSLIEAHAAEEKRTDLTLVPQDVRLAGQVAVARLNATAERKGQSLALLLSDQPVNAAVDGEVLGQILENLLGNALKFSPPGSTVELAMSRQNGTCRIEVRDEGPGVPPEERGRLFQKFHRGTARPTGGEASTGLGLFIVRALAEAMSGAVRHEPRDGGGSVFVVLFPGRD